MKYTTSGSSAPSANVATLLSSIGYRNVSFGSYSENQVCDMINHQCPVYIEGKGYDAKEQKSLYHAWVIDGVCQQRRKVETRSLATHEVLSLKWEYRNLFHCNFGYASSYDGYYVTDIYDFHAGAEFTDPMIDDNKQTKDQGYAYTQEFKIITHAYSL